MFRTTLPSTRTRRPFGAALCLSLALLLNFAPPVAGCQWDYPIWMPREKDADPLYRFIRGGKAGYIDRSGKVVIEPQFEPYGNYSGVFHDGIAEVGVSSGKYVDATGKPVAKEKLYRGWDFSEGLAAALAEDGGKWGYVDRTGEFAISPRFEGHPNGYVSSFSEGRAWVQVSGRYGFIDRTGEFAILPAFLHAENFHDGMARVVVEGPCAFASDGPCPSFRVLGGPPQPMDDMGACRIAFVDKDGVVLKERFEMAKDFSEGLAPVMQGRKWGFIDKSGRVVIAPRFDDAWPFSEGLARVRQGELYGYVDARGAPAVPPRYGYADDFSEGLAAVGRWDEEESDHDDFHYIDRRGRTVIAGPFRVASHFFKGLAHVRLKPSEKVGARAERYAYIDAKGKTIFAYEVETDED